MKVDVVVVSKHPVTATRNLWICDGGIPINKVIVETSTPLAKARQRAIRRVSTDWFVFLDDDIILPDDWWGDVAYLTNDVYLAKHRLGIVGAAQGTAIPHGLGTWFDKRFADHFSNLPAVQELNGSDRLYTHNTLIRTDAVRDWNPPDDLSSYEDYDLMRHIQEKGYRCFVVKTETYHKYSWSKLWPMGRWGTRGKLKFFPRRTVVKDFLSIPLDYARFGFRIGTVSAVKKTAGLYELVFGGK
jgi:glycosyltransferase involved in cell wall biosynthesis